MKNLIFLIFTLISLQASATDNLANIYLKEVKILPALPTWAEYTFNNIILEGEYGEESQRVKEIIIRNKKLYLNMVNHKFIKNMKSQMIAKIKTDFIDSELDTAIQYISLTRKLKLSPVEKKQIQKIKESKLHLRIRRLNEWLASIAYSNYDKIVEEFFINITLDLNAANIIITKEDNGNYVFKKK